MATYKAIVLDLDDTLLQDDLTVSDRTIEALIEAQKRGKKVILASGRPQFAMQHLVKQLQLDTYESYILAFNGGVIIDCKTKEIIYCEALTPERAHTLYDIAKREQANIHTYKEAELITDEDNPFTNISSKLTGMKIKVVPSFKEAITEPVVKVLMGNDPDKIAVLEEKVKEELKNDYDIVRSKPYFLEFTKKGINKGASLHYLLQQLGIDKEEVIACGDSYNDLDLIKYAGLGVAMGNAQATVKEAADYITTSNNEEGIALVVEEFMLNEA
ncbi:MAG: Cof-type HAD-IIB family hydrolase [Bacillaceae bacterium]